MPKAQFTSKICPACNLLKDRSEYYKKCNTVSHKCKPCTLAATKLTQHLYLGRYDERVNAWRQQKYKTEQSYRDRIAAQKKVRYDRLSAELNANRRERWANDPLNPARKYNRLHDVRDRTPKWVDLDVILAIYAKCPDGHEVDHIVPLKGIIDGRPVSGLHVPWNLQYLTVTANRKKHNRVSERDIEGIFSG